MMYLSSSPFDDRLEITPGVSFLSSQSLAIGNIEVR